MTDAISVFLAATTLPFSARVRWFNEFRRWQKRARAETVVPQGSADVTAILLAYRRPQNIVPIVRSLLRVPQIGRVLVSNNNSRTSFPAGLGLGDPRVQVVQQVIDRPTHLRFSLALADGAPYFLFVDDDVFLTPVQIDRLLRKLKAEPDVPHGVIGQIYDAWMDRVHHNVRDHEGRLEILNCVYAVTREHAAGFFRLAESLGIVPGDPMWNLSVWDDMVLSHAGAGKPKTHCLGTVCVCPSAGADGIAVFRTESFFRTRMHLLQRLRKLRPL